MIPREAAPDELPEETQIASKNATALARQAAAASCQFLTSWLTAQIMAVGISSLTRGLSILLLTSEHYGGEGL